jgi:hypothetical protein
MATKKAGTRSSSPKKASQGMRGGESVAKEIERIRDDLGRRAEAIFEQIDAREKTLEKEGLRLARSLVRRLRVALHQSMGKLGKRVAQLERRAATLERRLS